MNLVNYEVSGLEKAYAAVRSEAEKLGVEIANTEIVGLVPEAALDKGAEYYQRLENFGEEKILEERIQSLCH
jgi:glutamate formiminotransferase